MSILIDALGKYPFRERHPEESDEQYTKAVIDFIETRDWALAHEIRVNTRQPEWDAVQTDDFRKRVSRKFVPREPATSSPGGMRMLPMSVVGRIDEKDVTESMLIDMAETALGALLSARIADPEREVPALVHVLLSDGQILYAAVNPEERVSVLRALVQAVPVFGYFVLLDVFMHGMPAEGREGKATKQDALIAHIGTREMRRMVAQPYQIDGARVVAGERSTLKKDTPKIVEEVDPYAGVFAMPGQSSSVN